MKDYAVKIPSGSPVYPQTEKDWFQFPFVLMSVAKKNSGKTASLSWFLHILKKMDRLDRLILVSPTYHTNSHYFEGLPLDDDDVIEPSINSATEVMEKVEDEGIAFDAYHEQLERWNQLQKEIKDRRKNVNDINEDLMLEFLDMEKPKYKYMRNGKPYKPIVVCFFDDCQGTDAYSPSKKNMLNFMTIKHRHISPIQYGDGKAIGVNLMFALQNYTSNAQGIPKAIRGNCNIISLFKNKNEHELKLIAEEVSGEVDKETFFKVFEKATSVPYGFLTIDLNPKKTVKSQFRRAWNEYLYV
tara:strand:- start:259 stop:1155 length:897 start_codon:yes stop_codon:yes gene_type:complete